MNQNTPTGYNQIKLPYTLTNDYLFRAVFQSRPKALEGLCRAVLGLSEKDSISISIQNPIELGKTLENKDFILDLAILINNSQFLNLEMQVYVDKAWIDRSLSYVCRSFDNVNKGESYDKVLPVIHVGFLDYTLFPEHPEFYAAYQLTNVTLKDNPYIYSDKLRISVVNLTQIELATEKDRAYGVDLWAKVFKATTWEEITMLAQNNEYLQEVVSGVRQLTEEEKIRQQCQAREDFIYWERIRTAEYQRDIQRRVDTIVKQQSTIIEQQSTIDEQQSTIDEQQSTIDEQQGTIDEQQSTINEQQNTIAHLTNAVAEKDNLLAFYKEYFETNGIKINPQAKP